MNFEKVKKHCTITGLSPQQFPFSIGSPEEKALEKSLKEQIKNEILQAIQEEYTEFYCGMELGCELWAGEILLELRQEFPIKITSVIASEHRADDWSDEDREKYFDEVLPNVDEEIYASRANSHEAIPYRNKLLAQRTDKLIAVDNGADISDVADLIRRVKKLGKEIVLIEI
ncbi:MAG: SLOG family protein [Eubacteriales bacterium]